MSDSQSTPPLPVLDRDMLRVLGVLVEKSLATPASYPMTLNSLVAGCNQKSNREPTMTLSEDRVLAALDRLRAKGLAAEVMLSGSRVAKFRHRIFDAFELEGRSTPAVLTELILRGPQTIGELRGRASRMQAIESTDAVRGVLDGLMQRQPPLVTRLPPAPGTRAEKYAHLLGDPPQNSTPAPNAGNVAAPPPPSTSSTPATNPADSDLDRRMNQLEKRFAILLERLGESIPEDG